MIFAKHSRLNVKKTFLRDFPARFFFVLATCFCMTVLLLVPLNLSAQKVASGYAVWAYRTNPNPPYHPRGWHPCYIHYVASQYPHPRYGSDGRYVRVRTAGTKQQASHYVSLFSMNYDDRPDGVVKFHSCSKAKFSRNYAELAISQNQQNIRRRCGKTGRRWQSDFRNHYNWALGVSQSLANHETNERKRALQSCK